MLRIRHVLTCLGLVTLASAPAAHTTARMPTQQPPVAPAARSAASLPLPSRWLQGYAKTIAGEWIVYPWAYPGQINTLLSRATDGRMAVEWEGEAVPPGESGDTVTYLWHAGTASGYGAHRFTLAVNTRVIATFKSGATTADREWTVAGEGGARLSFRTTRVGQFNELFGFMWVTAPRSLFGSGAPRFRVTGEAADSQDYYLGPQQVVKAWTRVHPQEALFADGRRVVWVGISHLGPDSPARVLAGGKVLWSGTLSPGYTTVLAAAGPNLAASMPFAVTVGAATTFSGSLALNVVRPRTIHLLPHSHVDIGYSDPQPEVERKQWKNLRDAVELGRKTLANPLGARFKWNVEGLWSVESYLAQATPAERVAFADAVRAGTIGLQANYTNILTGLATPGELRRWTDAARRVRTTLGAGPIRSAMHSDIPGLNWTVVAALAQAGVRYFSSGPNYVPGLPDGGDRVGGTLRGLGDKPFWWTSPSGEERLLFWMAGRGYSWFHGINAGRMSDSSRDSILEYVNALVEEGYRYDMIQVRYTTGGDNGPADPELPNVVKRWNEQFSSPRLVINTAEAMFAEFERRYGAELPLRSGDMTPYWEDGALSTSAEEMTVRGASRRLQQAETLAALRGITLPASERDAAWRNILLWREHTWGAADSISRPDRADVVAQWDYKRRFATEADRLSRSLMQACIPSAGEPAAHVDVINTLSWPRTGLAYLSPDQSRAGDRVVVVPLETAPAASALNLPTMLPTAPVRTRDVPELVLPSQRLRDGRLAVWIEHVPALSAIRLRITPGSAQVPAERASATESVLENGRIRLAIDGSRAAAMSLAWSGAPGHDFASGAPGLFRYFYVDGRDPVQASASTGGHVTIEDSGPLVATLLIDSPAAGSASSARRFTLVAGSDQVSAEIGFDKRPVRSKESAHVAFPFNVPGGVIRVDQGEALVEIERDMLPGSCRDFIGVQSAIDVSSPSQGVSLVSLDAPLFELGAITDERINERHARTWREHVAPGTTLYAYLLNNYWHTNYKADQQGPLLFRFVVRPHGPFDPVSLRRLSDEHDYPLLAVSSTETAARIAPLFALEGDPVVVSALRADDDGRAVTVRLFNPSSTPAQIALRPTSTGTVLIVTGPSGALAAPGGRFTIPPLATRLVRLTGR